MAVTVRNLLLMKPQIVDAITQTFKIAGYCSTHESVTLTQHHNEEIMEMR
jgi:hypothetical protein